MATQVKAENTTVENPTTATAAAPPATETARKEIKLFACRETSVKLTLHPNSDNQFSTTIRGQGHCRTIADAIEMVKGLDTAVRLPASGRVVKFEKVLNVGNGGKMSKDDLLSELAIASDRNEQMILENKTAGKKVK